MPISPLFRYTPFSFMIFAGWLFVSSCASKVAPGGGPKDVAPPTLVKAEPENYSANFNAKEITIAFDEFIQLKDLEKQLVISPILKPLPSVTIKKKNLVIKFNSDLEPNTTYTLNFGNAVADIHEGNAVESFQYVFSTGAFVDSLSVKGKTVNAQNRKAEKGILVMLYRSNEDSLPLKNPPDYFSKTDESGNFIIKNIAAGSYKIFALADADGNYLFNSSDEMIGYNETQITSTDSAKIEIRLFKEEAANLFLKKSFFENKAKAILMFNKPAKNIWIKPVDENANLPIALKEYSLNYDSLTLWLADTLTDTLKCIIGIDSAVIDTAVIVRYTESKLAKAGSPLRLSGKTNASSLKPVEKIMLSFSLPVDSSKIKIDSIKIFIDSVETKNFTVKFIDTLVQRNAEIDFIVPEKKQTRLMILPGAFTSIYGITNDTIKSDIVIKTSNSLGSVLIKLKNIEPGSYLLQLLNDKDETLEEKNIPATGDYLFENLIPMKYKLRLIADINNNLKWDTGKYLKKVQPEKVFYYKEELNIRANWDLEQEWIIK